MGKEVHFFDRRENYSRGINWYRREFIGIRERQRREKNLGRPCLAFDSTPGYIFYQDIAERIAAALPGRRFIALLRNPVDRIWSHYRQLLLWEQGRAFQTDDLMPALQRDQQRYKAKGLPVTTDKGHASLFSRCRYGEQVKRWYEYVGKNNLLLLRSEDFYSNPQQTLNEVQDFLGVEREILPVARMNLSPAFDGAEIPPQTADWIREVLATDMQLLESLTGRQWHWW